MLLSQGGVIEIITCGLTFNWMLPCLLWAPKVMNTTSADHLVHDTGLSIQALDLRMFNCCTLTTPCRSVTCGKPK